MASGTQLNPNVMETKVTTCLRIMRPQYHVPRKQLARQRRSIFDMTMEMYIQNSHYENYVYLIITQLL